MDLKSDSYHSKVQLTNQGSTRTAKTNLDSTDLALVKITISIEGWFVLKLLTIEKYRLKLIIEWLTFILKLLEPIQVHLELTVALTVAISNLK